MEMLKEIITSNGGAFAVVFAVLWAVGYSLIKFTEWKCKVEQSDERTSKVESDINAIKADIHYIKGTLDILKNTSSFSLTQAHSPISLTLRGQEVAKEMRIEEMVARNWDKIETAIDANVAFKNAYDIQQFCIEKSMISLDTFFAPSDIDAIKMFAYNNGQPLAFYASMIGVIIRDKYFEIKKIPLAKVDETDPNR